MAQVIFANQRVPATSDGFYAFWVLTRALLAAGYKYKASGDAKNLAEIAEVFARKFQDTPWAKKASVWARPSA